jgi:hypothetical protein
MEQEHLHAAPAVRLTLPAQWSLVAYFIPAQDPATQWSVADSCGLRLLGRDDAGPTI